MHNTQKQFQIFRVIQSVVAEERKDVDEEPNDVEIHNECSYDVVVNLQLMAFPSDNELRVHHKVASK